MVRALTSGIVVFTGAGSRSIGVALRNIVAADEAVLMGTEVFHRTTGPETGQDKTQPQ
jgi:hypothetical protein